MTEVPKFESPEELATFLRAFSSRLHYLNRVAMGESGYVWWYAELLDAMSKMAPLMTEKEAHAAFGDGWTQGTNADPKALILDILSREMPDR